jgi:hypothetical protein
MSNAVWGLLGTLVGGLTALLTQVVVHRFERSDRKEREAAAEREKARDLRQAAYLRLLAAARALRYEARSASADDLDSLRLELSTVNYEIALIAPQEMSQSADRVRRKTLDYWNLAAAAPDDETATPEQLAERKTRRLAARQAVDDFLQKATDDLGLASATFGRSEAASQP